jgi:hypothetical protein
MNLTRMARKLSFTAIATGLALAVLPAVDAGAVPSDGGLSKAATPANGHPVPRPAPHLASAAQAAAGSGTQIYSGTGWKIDDESGLYSLSGDGTGYTLQFADAEAQTELGADVKQAAAQLTSVTGVKFTVSTTLKPSPENCADQPRHVMTLAVKYRPLDNQKGFSRALQCYNSGDHSAWGGWAFMDSEYWTVPNWFSTDKTVNTSKTKNAITHEIGHMVGLDHPNVDLNGDGEIADFECAPTPKNYLPVMCSPNGGYVAAADGGNFTSLDVPGLKQLAANWSLPIPAATKGLSRATPADGAPRGVAAGSAH